MCRDEREMGRERDLSVRERKDFMNKEKNLPDEKDRDCRTSKIAFIRDTERGEAHGCIFHGRKMRGVTTNVY